MGHGAEARWYLDHFRELARAAGRATVFTSLDYYIYQADTSPLPAIRERVLWPFFKRLDRVWVACKRDKIQAFGLDSLTIADRGLRRLVMPEAAAPEHAELWAAPKSRRTLTLASVVDDASLAADPLLAQAFNPRVQLSIRGWFGDSGSRLIASLRRRYPRDVVVALGGIADVSFFAEGEAMDRLLMAIVKRCQLSADFVRSLRIPPRPIDVKKLLRHRTGFAE